MSVAYDRALKNVPILAREGNLVVAIDTIARGLATEWSDAMLSNLPDGPNPGFDAGAFVTDYLAAEGNDYRVALGSLLGWMAGFVGHEPVKFSEAYSQVAEATFAAQLADHVMNVLESRQPNQSLEDFFKSDEMGAFLEQHAVGETPWSASLDGNGRIVLANSERSVFYTLTPVGGSNNEEFFVLRYDDAMHVIDTHSEMWIEVGETATSPSEALHQFMIDAGLAAEAPAP